MLLEREMDGLIDLKSGKNKMILMTDDIGDIMLCQQHSGGFKTKKLHYTAPSSPPRERQLSDHCFEGSTKSVLEPELAPGKGRPRWCFHE